MRLTAEEALNIIDEALEDISLTQTQEKLFHALWEGKSYKEIEGVEQEGKWKTQGYRLLQILEEVLGEKVTKRNLRDVFKRYLKRNQVVIKNNNVDSINDNIMRDFHISNHCHINKSIDKKE